MEEEFKIYLLTEKDTDKKLFNLPTKTEKTQGSEPWKAGVRNKAGNIGIVWKTLVRKTIFSLLLTGDVVLISLLLQCSPSIKSLRNLVEL